VTDLDGRLVLKPYRKLPDEYECAQCREPATGYVRTTGIVMFNCAEHEEVISERLWALPDVDYTIGMPVSQGWSYYLASFYWRLVNLRHFRANRRSKRILSQIARSNSRVDPVG
jgi:hypothetical protein